MINGESTEKISWVLIGFTGILSGSFRSLLTLSSSTYFVNSFYLSTIYPYCLGLVGNISTQIKSHPGRSSHNREILLQNKLPAVFIIHFFVFLFFYTYLAKLSRQFFFWITRIKNIVRQFFTAEKICSNKPDAIKAISLWARIILQKYHPSVWVLLEISYSSYSLA